MTVSCFIVAMALRWRHNDHDGVSNHHPDGCLLNRLFRRRSKKISKLRVTGLCVGNSPGTGEFPAQRASYAENVSIWWRHMGWVRDFLIKNTLRFNRANMYVLITLNTIHQNNHENFQAIDNVSFLKTKDAFQGIKSLRIWRFFCPWLLLW